ncbi:UNVERIFIED_CONTAM: hypothetical protein FKN15_035372 [Acipenser sinensis]
MAVMHTLVKWESGVDKDSYSVIPTAWIRNFDLFSIADDDEETTGSFRAEWRDEQTSKRPVHEAQIVMTANVNGPKKVEIFPGMGVYIDKLSWILAERCSTNTSYARTLTVAVFDIPTLLKSNLRVGGSKRDPTSEKKTPLDRLKVEAIYVQLCHINAVFKQGINGEKTAFA